MLMFRFRRKPAAGPMDFAKLLKKEIKPNARVLVIGPGTIQHDPSTLKVHEIVRKRGLLNFWRRRGDVVMLDSPTLNQLERTSGWGGLKEFKEAWERNLKKKAPPMVGGDAKTMPIKPNSVDVVYDHCTFNFVSKFGELQDKVLTEYLRVLKPGGKIILTSCDLARQLKKLKRFVTDDENRKRFASGDKTKRFITDDQKINVGRLKQIGGINIGIKEVEEKPWKFKNIVAIESHAANKVFIITKKRIMHS